MKQFFLKICLISMGTMPLADAENLVAFGKACLTKEAQLKQAESRLTEVTTIDTDISVTRDTRDALVDYEAEQNQLDAAITQCLDTTPNSAYCHQVRRRQNELAYLIEKSKATTLDNTLKHQDVSDQNAITQEKINQQRQHFMALCRDSDAHYSFIQSPTAYSEVCHSDQAKHTITCSFF